MRYPDFEGDIPWLCRRAGARRVLPWTAAPLWQRPEIVLGLGLAAGLLLIPTYDAVLMPWLRSVPRELHALLRVLTGFGEGVTVLVGSALLALLALGAAMRTPCVRSRVVLARLCHLGAFVFVAVATSGLVAALVKNCIGRARPGTGLGPDHAQPLSFEAALAAFPSGHSATGAAIAVVFGLLAPAHRWWLMWLGALVALSRPLLGAHWVSDAVAGWATGMAVALLVAHVFALRGLAFRYREGRGLAPRGCPAVLCRRARRVAAGLLARMMAPWPMRRFLHG